jgi:hypothetical protein
MLHSSRVIAYLKISSQEYATGKSKLTNTEEVSQLLLRYCIC